jgi:pimeloyl-ACP methyl ester carboxylesterase
MTVGYLEIGADRFPVAVQGTGMPILFVHGAPGDWRTFAKQAALLADRYRCITYTQRWFGNAEWRQDGPPFDTQTHTRDLIALAEALGMGKLNLVAWSYGAHPAFSAVVERPDLFSSLLVYEPGFGTYIPDAVSRSSFQQDAEAAWEQVVAARRSSDLEVVLRGLIDSYGGAGSYDLLPEEEKEVLRDSRAAMSLIVNPPEPHPLTCADLQRMDLPTSIGWGQQSRPCFTIPALAAVTCIGSERFEIADVGHLWPITHPEGFAKVVDYWLGQLPQPATG